MFKPTMYEMENLFLEAQKDIYFSPRVDFNADAGVCELSGESYLEDAFSFYATLHEWIEAFTGDRLIFKFNLTYFNTSSSKGIVGIFKALKNKEDEGRNIFVSWYYPHDNHDLMMEGEDFMEESGLKVMFMPYHME